MGQSKEFFSRIVHKHDTETNWNKAENFVPIKGEIIIYDKDENYNYERIKVGDGETKVPDLPFSDKYHTPSYTATPPSNLTGDSDKSFNLKIGTGTNINDLYVPLATNTVAGATIVYPAENCSTFTSDFGALTPAAAKKAVDTFAITKAAGGTLTNRSSAQKDEPSIGWKTIGANTPYIGFAKDQADGTFVWSLRGTNYQSGLAIGGGTGNLLWKGSAIPVATRATLTASRALASDNTGKITQSAVTSTELGYLSGVTSAIQTQINGKQATVTGAATTIANSDLTANRALISNSSGKVAVSEVTSTELGYLDGVTSAIQTQINNKLQKLDYEWNKSYNAGGTAGYLLIGSFPMYDSNVTIDIDSTTNTTYHGTVVIATQNVSESSIGSAHTITVYGDPTGAISDAIRVVWTSGSRNYNVYFVPSTWSKNLIHIRALGNYLENIDESKICTQFTNGTAPTTTSGLTVVNALRTNFNNYSLPAATSSALGGVKVGSNITYSNGTISLSKANVTTALGYTPPTQDTIYTHPSHTAKSSGLYKITVDSLGHVSAATAVAKSDITGLGIPAQDTTYSAATTSAAGLMSATDKAKLNNTNVAYGTCSTAAATAAKVVTLSGNDKWSLTNGAIIMVKFSESNTAESVTLNVNNTGAYPIWYNASEYTGTSSAYCGYAGRTITYAFNGTHWIWISSSYDANTQSNTNSTDTSSKIFLVGATTQGSNKTTYSHGEVYVGTDHHVYSNSKQVVNLSDTQALTNKTYNGYTLGAACAKGVDTTATSGSANLITSGAMYTALSGKATSAQGTKADNAMPKSGGTFTGNVKAYDTNRNTIGGCLRNILVADSTGNTLQSTNSIKMRRK